MTYHWLLLWTDTLLFILVAVLIILLLRASKRAHLRSALKSIITRPSGMMTMIILLCYLSIALLDSVHFQVTAKDNTLSTVQIERPIQSLLDRLLYKLANNTEKTYSKPFATTLYNKQTFTADNGDIKHDYPELQYGGQHLKTRTLSFQQDIMLKTFSAIILGVMIAFSTQLMIVLSIAKASHRSVSHVVRQIWHRQTPLPWRSAFSTILVLSVLITIAFYLAQFYHIMGTDKVGNDVFYESIKSIRTGLLIGTLTTLVMLPFALLFGISAGYFGGRLDDFIQYLYTTLSSIPGVLLIAAAILSLQVAISQNPDAFPTLAHRADARLLALCIILGVTSWTSLCRILRAETLKIRELDYVHAARCLGASHLRIMRKHILPNIMHIVVITVILDFSSLVLAEAVLSYIGIGVDPTMISWGNMINAARLEMAREPIVWWPLLSAFIFMFTLVLSANIFSDAVRDGFDPRLAK